MMTIIHVSNNSIILSLPLHIDFLQVLKEVVNEFVISKDHGVEVIVNYIIVENQG